MQKLKLLDLFSGIGGFTYAAQQLVGGFKTVQFVEIDPFCQLVLRKHFSDVPIHDDIQTFKPMLGAADVVTGGFPCQDISYAGNNAGIKQGTRSGLFYELIRVICKIRPSYVVLENVAALRKRGLDIVLGSLAKAGFNCEWACIPAADLGASHRRDRIWIVAYAQHTGLQGCRSECELRESGKEVKAVWRSCHTLSNEWRKYLSKPTICRRDDGFSHRVDRIKALGNAVVPQVAAVPLNRVIELHTSCQPPNMTLAEYWILQRCSDGKFFCDPTGPDNVEWIETPSLARTWLDYNSCCSAATVWKKLKGEKLQVKPFTPITSKQFDQVTLI